MEISTIVTWVIIAALFLYLVSIFNRLVSLKNRFQNAFSQIDDGDGDARVHSSWIRFS